MTFSCATEDEPTEIADPSAWPAIAFDPAAKGPQKLSTTGLARVVDGKLIYHPDLIPYDLNVPLFSDYSVKKRALWVPKGEKITWQDTGPLVFPQGSVIVKSFLFPQDFRTPDKDVRAIETRVMVRDKNEWKAWPYIWDKDGAGKRTGDASLKVSGGVQDISFIDADGKKQTSTYLVPQRNQCLDCHDQVDGSDQRTGIIGPKARWLNRDGLYGDTTVNQLQHLHDLGLLDGLPDLAKVDKSTVWQDVQTAGVEVLTGEPLKKAARDYLDINCAHCHSPTAAEGQTSQLYLNHDNDNAFLTGVCKAPSSAGKGGFGRKWDIVAGKPDESILVYRLETSTLGAMMPDIGRSLPHTLGIALVRKWITEMPHVNCSR